MLKKITFNFIFIISMISSVISHAEDSFTGEKKAACEAIICLSRGNPPSECDDSLKKYFKIVVKNSLGVLNPVKTLKARKKFLKLCPSGDDDSIDEVNTVKSPEPERHRYRREHPRDHHNREMIERLDHR